MIDFSDPIYTYGEGLVVPKSDTKDYDEPQDLKGEVVGAQVGTAFVDAAEEVRPVQPTSRPTTPFPTSCAT